MKILALDTATPVASVAVVEDQRIAAESFLGRGTTHSLTLLPEIERLQEKLGLKIADLDLLAVGVGPGSFTGLRIGLAVAKGLSWAAGKPLVGVPTLDAIARHHPPGAGQMCPLIDARKHQVYTALYRPNGRGEFERRQDIQAYDVRQLAGIIGQETLFFGPGMLNYRDQLAHALGERFREDDPVFNRVAASAIAAMAEDLFLKGTETNPGRIQPLYVRPPDIQVPAGQGLVVV